MALGLAAQKKKSAFFTEVEELEIESYAREKNAKVWGLAAGEAAN